MPRRIAQHLRSNVVAYVALFFALGLGTAWALERNSVRSKHIKDANVREADLGPAAVTPGKIDLQKHNILLGTTSTMSLGPEDTSQPGPIVTVDVPANALVAVYAEVAIRRINGTSCHVHLAETNLPGSPREIMHDGTPSFTTNYTRPGALPIDNTDGVSNPVEAGWITLNPGPGSHSYKLQYSALGPSQECEFTNRKLYVAVVG